MDFTTDSTTIITSLKRLLELYPEIKKQRFSSNTPVQDEIDKITNKLRQFATVNSSEDLLVKFGYGIGGWAAIPHISVLDKRRTTTVQKGIYIVILLKEDMSGLYLTLNQGVTKLINSIKRKRAYDYFEKITNGVRKSISSESRKALIENGFSLDNDIYLSDTDTGHDYRQSTIFHKYYEKNSLSTDNGLLSDLELLIDIYLKLPKEEDLIPSSEVCYWIFQSNPRLFDLKRAVGTSHDLDFTVSSFKDQIKIGDQVFLWISGSNSGVIGRATVISLPEIMPSTEEQRQFDVTPGLFDGNKLRVKLRVDQVLTETLTRTEILKHKELKELSIIRSPQGTNFAVSETEAKFLITLIETIRTENKMIDTDIQTEFEIGRFISDLKSAGLLFEDGFIVRFIAAICTKPFTILTGLSGSGKTKLALAFSKWITRKDDQICVVPVGADWTNREPLLGYPNALEPNRYVKPDTGVLDFLIRATKNPSEPYFLILDEMNLSHVERYFADFLSGIESGEPILLRPDNPTWQDKEIPESIFLPRNLFIVGTVNVDETTYMFSPKVLDRAGVLEFRVTQVNMMRFLEDPKSPMMFLVEHQGSAMQRDFLRLATSNSDSVPPSQELITTFSAFFGEMQKLGAEFGYRTAYELNRFGSVISELTQIEEFRSPEFIADAGILQKLLPRVHGSRRKLEGLLKTLIGFCLVDGSPENVAKLIKSGIDPMEIREKVKYPLSFEKLIRMHNHVIQDGFTSFSEA